MQLDELVAILAADVEGAARQVIEQLARAHQHEDVDAYLAVFDPDAVWVTRRGECFRGRATLGGYLRQVIPGGLGDGAVAYQVESVHPISTNAVAVVVEQIYLDAAGEPRDSQARHTHTYVLADHDGSWRIVAGQNTVRQ